jgi:hypothetical protein
VPTENRLSLSLDIVFSCSFITCIFRVSEIKYDYHCCADCGEVGTLLLFLIHLLLIMRLLLRNLISQTINLVP